MDTLSRISWRNAAYLRRGATCWKCRRGNLSIRQVVSTLFFLHISLKNLNFMKQKAPTWWTIALLDSGMDKNKQPQTASGE